jgi:hypothetical protein
MLPGPAAAAEPQAVLIESFTNPFCSACAPARTALAVGSALLSAAALLLLILLVGTPIHLALDGHL